MVNTCSSKSMLKVKASLKKRKNILFVKTKSDFLSIKSKITQKNLEVTKQKCNFALSLRGMDNDSLPRKDDSGFSPKI